ncbi:MAG: hypothetical protein J5950_02275 [Clostridia bacterium]|nr:hypothetical protein [Clostridia bacterium]
MKKTRRAAMLILTLALVTVIAAGCAGKPQTDPGTQTNAPDGQTENPTEEPVVDVLAGYTIWSSGREQGTAAAETSKQVEEYEAVAPTAEEFSVAYYFGNNMIVPRDRKIVIWGTAPESQNGKIVAAEFKGLKGSGTIENGEFSFYLSGTLPASGEKGHSLIVRGADGFEKEFQDVLVGDIWLVSGQSNADLTFTGTVAQSTKDLKNLYGSYLDNATADDNIRIMHQINWNLLNTTGVKRMKTPQTDVTRTTKWQIAERKRVYGASGTSFSMLGYFFAKELYTINPDVPIGIIMTACGGAPLSLLVSADALEKFPASLKNRSLTLNGITIPPAGIYNAFAAPMEKVGVTGIIFYQGESDADKTDDYCIALKASVEDFREKFGSDLLFLNVQLTSYGYESGGAKLEGVWDKVPEMRFAQSIVKIDGSIHNYEVIPSIDVGWREGDGDGAHPYYKLELGQRGAKMAAAIVYGIGDMENAGCPIPGRIGYKDNEIVIEYKYAGGGLKTVNGAAIAGFEVKKGGSWQKVEPVIEGNLIRIAVDNAQGVRYAADLHYTSTDTANLCSGTDNIAVPFSVEFN